MLSSKSLKSGFETFFLFALLKAYGSVDEHSEELSRDGLQELSIVQLAEHDLLLQNVVLQDDFQQALVHGHHLL